MYCMDRFASRIETRLEGPEIICASAARSVPSANSQLTNSKSGRTEAPSLDRRPARGKWGCS